MSSSSRIQKAQERVRLGRYAIGGAAGVAFLGLGVLARATHPGHHHAAATTSSRAAIPAESASFSQASSSDFFGDPGTGSSSGGGSTIAPSQSSAPAVQSSGS